MTFALTLSLKPLHVLTQVPTAHTRTNKYPVSSPKMLKMEDTKDKDKDNVSDTHSNAG